MRATLEIDDDMLQAANEIARRETKTAGAAVSLLMRGACVTNELLDSVRVADASRIHGPRQIADLYLLALAVRHSGRLVIFGRSIASSAIRGATERHLVSL
jgi:predicted nucleic acid-binding protein